MTEAVMTRPIQRLLESPYKFSLDQAVYICEQHKFVVRLKGQLCYHLQPYEVMSASREESGKITLTTNRMDLLSQQSPLPFAYREILLREKRLGDTPLENFLGIFNHRLLYLSYRIAEKRFASLSKGEFSFSPIGKILSALSGVVRDKKRSPRRLEFLKCPWGPRRSLPYLEGHVQKFLRTPCKVHSFRGGWRSIELRDITFLGRQNHQLGQNTVLGTRVWDQVRGVSLTLSPKTLEEFCAFFPPKKGPEGIVERAWHSLLRGFLRNYLGAHCICHIRILPPVSDFPALHLGNSASSSLGMSTWLSSPGGGNSQKDPFLSDMNLS